MKKNLLLFLACAFAVNSVAQWNPQNGSGDLTTPIARTGIINLDGYNSAQIRLNSTGTYYGKIGNPSSQVWSLGWGTWNSDINPVLNWTAAGKIGIGTTSPGELLHVYSTLQYPRISVQSAHSAGAPGFDIRDASGTEKFTWHYDIAGGFMGFYQGGVGNRMVINNSGNVGIGLVTPQTLLNINQGAGDATTGTPALRIGGTGNYPSLEFGIKGAYDGMISTYGNDLHLYSGNWRVAGAVASENHNISFYTSQANSANWNTPKMYLRYDGNFGIGTTAPGGKLDINAGGSYAIRTSTSSRYVIEVKNTSDLDGGWWLVNDPNGSFVLHENSIGDQFTIKPGGNVGIGTTTPGNFKLAVNGKIWGTEVQVALTNPGPDYVFEKSYTLPTLEEVKSYIDQNKHLPEVPSAKEMEANGVNVGEMNMLLLKKIEELTLYLIEQQKEINELKNQIKK
jgi:hypothetical protein